MVGNRSGGKALNRRSDRHFATKSSSTDATVSNAVASQLAACCLPDKTSNYTGTSMISESVSGQ